MGTDQEPSYPPDYVPPFTHEQVKQRFRYLMDQCDYFMSIEREIHATSRLRCDHLVMANVAKSAMDDIWRFKVYHLRDPKKKANAIKRSAYFTKWIARLRPIYFDRIRSADEPDEVLNRHDNSLLVNEAFAVNIAFNLITGELKRAGKLKGPDLLPAPDFLRELLYDLHYRRMSADALMTIYELVKNEALEVPMLLK